MCETKGKSRKTKGRIYSKKFEDLKYFFKKRGGGASDRGKRSLPEHFSIIDTSRRLGDVSLQGVPGTCKILFRDKVSERSRTLALLLHSPSNIVSGDSSSILEEIRSRAVYESCKAK